MVQKQARSNKNGEKAKTRVKKVKVNAVKKKLKSSGKKVSSGPAKLKTSGMQKRQIELMDLERLVELDFVRTTEAAALNAFRWLGKGDRRGAHAAAVDAMRGTLDLTSVSATVVLGDVLNPKSDIQIGEKLGNWTKGSFKVDLAVIPVDGIDLVARGLWGAMTIMVAASGESTKSSLMNVPCPLMEKIAYGPAVAAGPGQVHLDASVRDNLEIISMKLGQRVQDLNVAVLDREENQDLIGKIRKAGASVQLIKVGEVGACMAPSVPDTGTDVYMGMGGSTEAVLAAAALRCLGGGILIRMAPQKEQERKKVVESFGEKALDKQYTTEDLARGDNVIFCATGISDGCILRGVHVLGNSASTESVVMRARFRTVRKIRATHDLSHKTIRLRSAGAEAKL